jgi:DDE_Tnp_1-associated
MEYNLQDFLSKVKDYRRGAGQRYPLWAVLSMIIMSIISGAKGYREFGRFMKANQDSLIECFKLKHGVPSHVTIRAILRKLDLYTLTKSFRAWMSVCAPPDSAEWLAIDGKSLSSTVTNPNDSLQNFVSVVSVFAQHSGLVYDLQAFENGKAFEPRIVRQLIRRLGLKDAVFTLDAIHCQKKP